MKLKKIPGLHPALLAVGVFLGRGAHADTILTFDSDASLCTPPQVENPNAPPGITNFGNFAAVSSGGVDVSGFGTPNIGLRWSGIPSPDTRWEYYYKPGTPWAGAVQLQGSFVNSTQVLTFVPNNPSASVTIESFRFDAYYVSSERFTYDVSVVSGTNVLNGPIRYSFISDATKNHLVTINYTGAPGQALKLKLARVQSTLGAGEIEGNAYNNSADDITFAQTPATTFPAGPQVVSVTPADDSSGLPATGSPPYAATIANGATLTVATPIQLKLDGSLVSPPPTITPLGGGQTSVTYPGGTSLLASGAHVYTLTYADNQGGVYTNETVFNTAYTTLPATFALPPGSGVTRGLTWRSVSAGTEATTNLDGTIARAIAQLNGTLTNPATKLPYTNSAALGPNPDGSFNVDTVSFVDNGTGPTEWPVFTTFPGLDFPPDNWFSGEGLLYLDLPAGYYRAGVNSDDGFEVNVIPPQGVTGAPVVVGVFDNNRGASDTLFDFLVQKSGLYPFQLIYFQSSGFANCQFFSVTNLQTGGQVLINDTNFVNAIKSYSVLAPFLTRVVPNVANVAVDWAYGNPPFQLQFKTNLSDLVWNNIGATTSNRTATVPVLSTTGFIRVYGQ
jgi:hypothetical protein